MSQVNFDSAEHMLPGYGRRVMQLEAEQALIDLAEQQAHEDAAPVLRVIRAMSECASPEAYALICAVLASQIANSNMSHQDCAQAAIEFLDDAATVIVEGA